ncbi:MAG TPA: alkaline phosphatase family protein [Thermoanaerobaculia bacterium]|nr:alkaline phosphatase family protein [Thermoanaerobaculia bacterium]
MTRRALPLLLLSLFACAPAPQPRVAPPPPAAPQLAATGTPHRVVLMSFDGLGADGLAAQTGLPAFDYLARNATTARVIPVNPTLTSSTHVSILTGADPQQHGIVSNWFHLPGTPADKVTRGIEADIDVQTIVEAARKQGKRVGAVLFPTLDARTARRSADFGMVWTTSVTEGRILKLTKADFRREWVPPTWTQRPQRRTSYSPVMRARVEWSVSRELRTDVDVVALDTSDDRVENYDAYVVESEDRELPLENGWFAIEKQNHGSWSKILGADALNVTLYWGAISRTNAYPETYRRLLDEEVGFWPGAPDERTDIDPNTLAEQIERLSDFLARAQALTVQRMEFDLLLAYQPVVDEALHNFLGYDDAIIHRAYLAADRAAAAVGSQLDGNRDAFLVMGDHGLVPITREIRLGVLLAQQQFAPRWRVFTANHVAHFYRTGEPDDSDALVAMLQGTGLFESVGKKSAASHRSSGDVVAVSFPPIGLTPSATPPLEGKPSAHGHHGALNTHRELHTVLFASGFGVPRGNLGEISQTRIAPFVASLLGIEF